MGKLVTAITAMGGAVCYAIDSTDMVAKAEQIHQSSAVVTAAMGRLLTATSMMGAALKGEDNTITLRLAGDGPTGSVVAVGNQYGNVKTYAENVVVELPLNEHGKLDVSGAVGKTGTLYVIKDLGLKDPYVGMTPFVSREIAEDVTSYFANSEQISTACGLGVLVNPDLTVKAAGGYILQLLPGILDKEIDQIEKNIENLPNVSAMIDSGMTAEQIAFKMLEGMDPELLDTRDVEYRCDCSKQRVAKAIAGIGAEEIQAMIDEDKSAEVNCHFCNKSYKFNETDLADMIK